MILGAGAPAREKITEELGGSVRHHNHPYQSRETAPEPKQRQQILNPFNSSYNLFLYLY